MVGICLDARQARLLRDQLRVAFTSGWNGYDEESSERIYGSRAARDEYAGFGDADLGRKYFGSDG